jgi:hypothetical protein
VIKQRVEQILAAPDSAAVVQALSPVEFVLLLKEVPETRSVLLALAHPEQCRTVLDLDCWEKDTVRSARVVEWLEELQRSGPEVFQRVLEVLDSELLVLTFRKYIRVHATLPTEEEEEPGPYDEVFANELYRIEFVSPDSVWNEGIGRLLQMLRLTDLDGYHSLMQGVMWGQDSELEEWAYRWKSGRLQDEGFPEYYDAIEAYRLADLAQPPVTPGVSAETPGMPESAEASGTVPSYAWGLTRAGSLLDTAVSSALSAETQERLCWEMVYLCNRELVIDQVDFAALRAVHASLARVHAYINIGLEYLRDTSRQPLTVLLTTHSLQTIYQIGVTLCLQLHQRALRVHAHLSGATGLRRALGGLAHRVMEGLLSRPPQCFEGAVSPGETGYRDFLSRQDITRIDAILTAVEDDPAYVLRRSA